MKTTFSAIALSTLGALGLAISGNPAFSASPRPNILLILADDMGYSDLVATALRFKRQIWINWHNKGYAFRNFTMLHAVALPALLYLPDFTSTRLALVIWSAV